MLENHEQGLPCRDLNLGPLALKSGVLIPTPRIHKGILQKKLRESLFNALLWQKVANIKGGKFKQGKIQIFKGP